MAEGSKVRCPKCKNLLPELPNYSLYKCGDCGALLRGKKLAVNGGPLEQLEKERLGEDFEKLESLYEKENNGVFLDKRKDRIFKEKNLNSVSNSLLRIQNMETSINSSNIDAKAQIVGSNEKHRSESINSDGGKGTGKFAGRFEGSAGFLRSKANVRNWNFDNRSRFSNFACHGEGPSTSYSYLRSPYCGHGKQVQSLDDANGANRFAHSEQERAELLRMLDELKEQICRSGSAVDKQKEGAAHFGPEIAPSGVYHGHVTCNAPLLPLPPDKHVLKPPYFKQYDGDMGHAKKFHNSPNHGLDELPFRVPMVNPHQSPRQCCQQPSHGYLQGEYMNFHQEQLLSYPQRKLFHEPAFESIQSYNKNWHDPSKFPATFGDKRFLEDSIVPSIGPRSHNPRANYSALRSKDAKSHYRWPSHFDPDMDALHRSFPGKVVVAHGNKRFCHPIAGGAPFIACYSCFESLKLPRKLKAREKNQYKLRCGACSTVFMLEFKKKQLSISSPAENKKQLAIGDDGSYNVSKEVPLSPDEGFCPEGSKFTVDFDSADYDFQSMDLKGNILFEDQRLNVRKSEERQELASQSSVSSQDANNLDSMIEKRQGLDSSFPEHFDDVSSNHEASRHEQGNESNITDQKKVALEESSAKNVSSETEVEVSCDEYLITSVSQDSMETIKEDYPFLAGIPRRSFRDLSRSDQEIEEEKPNVWVNGQPIADHIVKKVKKLAGPIQPGDYWYDFRAGFWGVMGKPCLGIIPPFIEELNHPMTRNCAAGNTGVFVNGRELHQKDLDLLARRGLPTTKEKFYIVEMSGRVYDKDTGKELSSLGKLAPTVEKRNRGFGMKVPRKS